MFLYALRSYLMERGFENIYCDFLPDKPDECIGLFCWDHTTPVISDGSGTRYIQIQARSNDGDIACETLYKIASLLDSGQDEEIINLTENTWGIGRIRRMPVKLDTDENNRVKFILEVSFWGPEQL